jgi:hypothetical protein
MPPALPLRLWAASRRRSTSPRATASAEVGDRAVGLAEEEGGDLEGDVAAEEVAQLAEAGEGVLLDLLGGGDEGGVDELDRGAAAGCALALLERGAQLADLDRLADVVVHAGGRGRPGGRCPSRWRSWR